MPEFTPIPNGVELALDETESAVLRQLTAELRAALTGKRKRNDAVIERLFPDAYEDDADEAAYRELTHTDLEKEKLRALDSVSTALSDGASEIQLTDEDLHMWLACLTDLRLAIGTRIGVDEERMSRAISADDPDAQAMTVLHWLGWVQEGLLGSIVQ